MPWKQITKDSIVFDPSVQTYCVNEKFRCPNYRRSWACPPVAPYLEKEIMSYEKFYLVYKKEFLPKDAEMKRQKYSSLRNWEKMREGLKQEIINLAEELKVNNKTIKILWEGHCQICEKEGKSCTYPENIPCRYPNKLRYSMEAVGINVTATGKNLELDLEWPPKNYVIRFGLICVKNSRN